MKSFRDQFIQCKNDGFLGKGELQKFKDHPEMLPHPFSKAAKVLARKLEEDPEFGLETISCLRFGGECSSGHEQCKKLRGFIQAVA